MSEKKIKNVFVEGAITPLKIADAIAHHQIKTNIGAHDIFLGQVRADEMDGKIVKSGGPELAHELEDKGYDWISHKNSGSGAAA